MTFAELGANLDKEIDESIGYYFSDDEKSYFLNKAVDRFRDKAYADFEKDETARQKLRLMVVDSGAQAGSTFNLALITDLAYTLRLTGVFTVSCTGGATQTVKRRIMPIGLDDLFDQDPFSIGINEDPKYEEVGNALQIISTTAPTNVIMTYLKNPTTVDITGNPAGTLEIPEQFQHEVLDLAKDILLENVNSPRYPTAVNDTVTQT